jgi:quinol monooxygenase YgiN
MDTSRVHVIERITAQPERIDELKRSLQQAAEYTKHIPGVRQLELLQNQQNPAEFIFFLIVDDLKQTDDRLNQANWHQQLVGELPRLMTGVPERVVGSKIA